MARDMIEVILEGRRRAKRAVSLRRKGNTYERIGVLLGVTKQRAHAMVTKALKANGK